MEMHLQELARDELQRQAVVALEAEVGDARREHAPRGEPEGELDDGHLPILPAWPRAPRHGSNRMTPALLVQDLRKTRSEEHTSELQSLMRISYAVFCLTKKNTHILDTLQHNNNDK